MRGIFGLLLVVGGGYVAFAIVTGRITLPGSGSSAPAVSGPGLGSSSSNVTGNPSATGGIAAGLWGTAPNGRTSGGSAA